MRRGALAALLAGLLAGAGCAERPAPQRVLVLVLDTTHAAHLSCYGGPEGLSPAVDALAERGLRFSHARSNNTWTLPSTVSLMSGKLQETHGVVTNHHKAPPDLTLLPELFAKAGYRTAAFTEMIYASAVHGLDRGFEDNHYYSMTAGAHPASMARDLGAWVEEHRDERWLLYVHMRRPHSPYEKNSAVQHRLAPDCAYADGHLDELLAHADSRVGPEGLPSDQAAHVQHLYRANIANADRAVGDLLRRLGNDDGLLVLLTSDHGEALGQHGSWGHGYRLEAECVDVPLLLAGAGIAPGLDAGPASTVDLLPTLLDLCHLPRPAGLDGHSLAPRLLGSRDREDDGRRPVFLSARYVANRLPAQGVVAGRYKLILGSDDRAVLYDLQQDPGETTDVSTEHADMAARLATLARARRASGADLAGRDTVPIEVREEELRALGYLR